MEREKINQNRKIETRGKKQNRKMETKGKKS